MALPDSTAVKRCSRCRNDKPRSDFYRNRRMRDGFDHYCKTCRISFVPTRPVLCTSPRYQQAIAEAKAEFDAWDAQPRGPGDHLHLIEADRVRRMRAEEAEERELFMAPSDRRNPGDILWDRIASAAA